MSTAVVTGKVVGATAAGSVTFTPSGWAGWPASSTVQGPSPITVPVAANGSFSATLWRTDNAEPPTWCYRVVCAVPGVSAEPFYIRVDGPGDIATMIGWGDRPSWTPGTPPWALPDGRYAAIQHLHPELPTRTEMHALIEAITGVDVSGVLRSMGSLTAGQDFNALTTQGIYTLGTSSALAGVLNGPAQQGDLDGVAIGQVVIYKTSSGAVVQRLYSYGNSGVWSRASANLAATSWTRWRQEAAGKVAGIIPANANARTYTGGMYRGDWVVTAENAPTISNIPAAVPGLLQVLSPTSTQVLQVYRSHEAVPRSWIRTRTVGGSWGAWHLQGGSSGGADTNRLLVEEATRRRGGRIGTGGRGAICLRFDHNVEAFRAKVLPLLVARGLPAILAMPADVLDPGYSRDPATTVTWSEVQGWAHHHGIEIGWHSKTHEPADDPAAWESEIVGGMVKLATNLPQVKVDVGIQIGTTGSMWGGLLLVDSPARLYGTDAGRVELATIPIVSGHMGGYFRPLTGQVQQGLACEAIESTASYADAAAVIALLTEARDTASGLCVYIHPSSLDASGYMTTATLTAVLDWLVAERDAGRLDVLTYSGLALADAATDYRHDLIREGDLATLVGWKHTGWTISGGWAVSPSTTDELYQDVRFTRRYSLTGAVRELVAEVTADTAATVRLRVRDTSSYSTLDTSRDLAIPAGQTRTVRMPFTIPYSATGFPSMFIRSSIARVSGGAVKVRNVRMTPA